MKCTSTLFSEYFIIRITGIYYESIKNRNCEIANHRYCLLRLVVEGVHLLHLVIFHNFTHYYFYHRLYRQDDCRLAGAAPSSSRELMIFDAWVALEL
jgi:hypothetical protein